MGSEASCNCSPVNAIIEQCGYNMNEPNRNESKYNESTDDYKEMCDDIETLFNSCIQNKQHNNNKPEKQKLLKLITTNEKTKQFAFNYLKKIEEETINKLQIDGDDEKSENEQQPELEFDKTTLEKRLSNFEDKVYIPSSIDELIDKMQSAVNEGIKIKPMGSRYAFSNVTFTDGLLVDMYNGLNDPNMKINYKSLNEFGQNIYNQRNLHLCQSGTSIEMIQNSIWPKTERRSLKNKETGLTYKALRDIPGGNQLCFGGCINVGAAGEGTPFVKHNNDKNFGSMTGHILAYSMIIIDENKKVRLVQIEPDIHNGAIHDAVIWNQEFPDVELIQNDDIFEAGLVSIGLLGIVYSYYILLEDAYFYEEQRYMISYTEFKETEWNNLRNEILNNKIEALELLVAPYKSIHGKFKGDQFVIITTYSRTNKVPPENAGGIQEKIPSFIVQSAAVTANWLTRIIPEIVPVITQLYLSTILHDGRVKDCTELGSVGVNVDATPTKANGFAFTYSKTKLFNFIDDWIGLMNDFRNNDKNQITPLPLAIRFSSYKTKGLLNMFNHENNGYFWFENIIPHFDSINSNIHATIENVDEILYKVQLLSQRKPYYGNPHWGLNIFLNKNENIFKNIEENKFSKFIKIYQKYNKTKTFSNQFSKQSGLDDIAQL